jgi:hypothetical protein
VLALAVRHGVPRAALGSGPCLAVRWRRRVPSEPRSLHQGSAKYLLAASGSQTTAPIIIETGRAVVTIGGFNGGDPAPTVTQLAAMVASGELKYVLISSGGGGGGPGGSGAGAPGGSGAGGHSGTSAIATWVKAHGTTVTGLTVSSGTLYKVG